MSYESLLAQIPMFEHLAQEDLTHLSGLLQQRRYSKNEVIFHQGDVGTALFMVRRGEVAIRLSSTEGKEVILALLGRGMPSASWRCWMGSRARRTRWRATRRTC